MLVDSHCHLDQLPCPMGALTAAAAAGVKRVVAVSEDPESIHAVLHLQRQAPAQVYPGLGLHPAWISRSTPAQIEAALELLDRKLSQAAVLGEAGLDHKWAVTVAERQYQSDILDQQLTLAERYGKPVALHSRRCLRQTMDRAIAFRERTGLQAQLHWFTHSRKLVRRCNEAGIFVSVGPTLIGHPPTQSVVQEIAEHLLLLETDAPVRVNGRTGHPAHTRDVAQTVADLKACTIDAVAALTTGNIARFLGRDATADVPGRAGTATG